MGDIRIINPFADQATTGITGKVHGRTLLAETGLSECLPYADQTGSGMVSQVYTRARLPGSSQLKRGLAYADQNAAGMVAPIYWRTGAKQLTNLWLFSIFNPSVPFMAWYVPADMQDLVDICTNFYGALLLFSDQVVVVDMETGQIVHAGPRIWPEDAFRIICDDGFQVDPWQLLIVGRSGWVCSYCYGGANAGQLLWTVNCPNVQPPVTCVTRGTRIVVGGHSTTRCVFDRIRHSDGDLRDPLEFGDDCLPDSGAASYESRTDVLEVWYDWVHYIGGGSYSITAVDPAENVAYEQVSRPQSSDYLDCAEDFLPRAEYCGPPQYPGVPDRLVWSPRAYSAYGVEGAFFKLHGSLVWASTFCLDSHSVADMQLLEINPLAGSTSMSAGRIYGAVVGNADGHGRIHRLCIHYDHIGGTFTEWDNSVHDAPSRFRAAFGHWFLSKQANLLIAGDPTDVYEPGNHL